MLCVSVFPAQSGSVGKDGTCFWTSASTRPWHSPCSPEASTESNTPSSARPWVFHLRSSFNALNPLFIIIQCVHVHVFLIASCVRSLTLMKMLYRLEWIHTELHIFALTMLSCLRRLSVLLLSKPVCFWGSILVSIPRKLRPLCWPTAFHPTLWTKDKAHDVKAWLSGTQCASGFVYHDNVLYLALNPAEFMHLFGSVKLFLLWIFLFHPTKLAFTAWKVIFIKA